VEIEGNSPLLLSQVRQIEPQAFVRQRDGIIQAGVFADEYNAESRVRALAARGIRAQVTAIADSGTPWAIATGTDAQLEGTPNFASDLPQYEVALRGYFVVIPGKSSDLPNIAAEVVRLGVTESAVSQREAPRGPHVAIGPFESRRDADRWTNYFRSAGMDARVYFGQ
jgi:superfamily II DNA helicase RecQ